jgi:ADP-ribosylation factor protein 1
MYIFLFLLDALKPSEVADLMCLHKMSSRKWFIQAACATSGEGLCEAMNEMATMVKEYRAGRH